MQSAKTPSGEEIGWIGIAAPSSSLDEKLFSRGLERFANWGVPVRVDETVHEKMRYFAGTDEVRAKSLHALVKDPLVQTIWCARGGYGAARILALLDKLGTAAVLRRQPKVLAGYSDVTALHFYFYQRARLGTLHCSMPATNSWLHLKPRVDRLLREILAGRMKLGQSSHTAAWKTKKIYVPRGGSEGVLLGGNLSLIASLMGTPWQPNLRGAILFLEDCGENPYRVDRMLTQMESAGVFRGLAGVAIGDFEAEVSYREPGERRYWREVLFERFLGRGIPIVSGLPVGHGPVNEPLPLGVRAAINSQGRLLILQQVRR